MSSKPKHTSLTYVFSSFLSSFSGCAVDDPSIQTQQSHESDEDTLPSASEPVKEGSFAEIAVKFSEYTENMFILGTQNYFKRTTSSPQSPPRPSRKFYPPEEDRIEPGHDFELSTLELCELAIKSARIEEESLIQEAKMHSSQRESFDRGPNIYSHRRRLV